MTSNIKTKEYFLKMVAAVICEQPIPSCPTDIDIKQLYRLSVKNSVDSILYLAIKKGNLSADASLEKKLYDQYIINLMRDTMQEDDRAYIRKRFTEENIDFMLLKGSHLKELYPVPEIRYMVDMDILIHTEDIENGSNLLLERGFNQYKDNDKDIIFTKKPCLTIELHQMLFIEDYFMHEHFTDVWEKAIKVSEHEYKMSYNDLYVYTLAHLAEHYMTAGSCFRPMMDLFLMEKKLSGELDFSYINKQFTKIGIDKFAEKVRKLYKCMFAGGEYDDDLIIMENYIIFGAPVKNAEEAALAASTRRSKTQRIFETAFPNYRHMKTRYPILKKLPFLMPIFWIIRIIHYIFTKDSIIKGKRNQLKNSDQRSTEIMRDIFDRSGL